MIAPPEESKITVEGLGQVGKITPDLPARPMLPAAMCPLSHVRAYAQIDTAARRRFEQLYVCAFHENIAFLESTLAARMIGPLLADSSLADLHVALRRFGDQEVQHSRAFLAWNRQLEPTAYAASEEAYVFVQPGRVVRALWTGLAARARQWPWLLWFVMLQEERTVALARELTVQPDAYDAQMVALHAWHLRDEDEHVACDVALVQRFWGSTPAWRRRLNARLLQWILHEFFTSPKRSGCRVLDLWLQEHPQYRPLAAGMRAEFAQLNRHRAFLKAHYGQEMVATTLELMAAWPEFDGLRRWFDGIHRGADR